MFGYAIRIMGLTKFLSINDSVVATVETPKYKFRDIKLFFNVLNSYFVDFIFKLDKELHVLENKFNSKCVNKFC